MKNLPSSQFLSVLMTWLFVVSATAGPQDTIPNQPTSQSTYLDQRVHCHIAMADFYARLRSTNQAQPANKTHVSPAISQAQARQQVSDSLRMEQALYDHYGVSIDDRLLQNELDRMAHNTRDPEKLSALFKLFNNNADVIAECVARPHLVKRLLIKQHQSNHPHNRSLQQAIEGQIKTNTQHSAKSTPASEVIHHKYVLEGNPSQVGLAGETALDEGDFVQKQGALMASGGATLYENNRYFYTEKLLQQTTEMLTVEIRSWPKLSFDQWWQETSTEKSVDWAQPIAKRLKISEYPIIDHRSDWSMSQQMDEWQTFIPGPRKGHSAVWTGQEMIIWGGFSSQPHGPVFYGDGFRYDPITDVWTSISMQNAPSPRIHHTAVWTGARMIVWGGNDLTDYFQDGRIYHPESDSWALISRVNAPSKRYNHQALWTGSQMIIWGGYDRGEGYVNGHVYDYNTNRWSAITTPGAPALRYTSSLVWTGTEMIVWGGRAAGNELLDSGGRYNPRTKTWRLMSQENAPIARYEHLAVWTGEKMLIWGSYTGSGDHRYGGIYDPDTDSWSQMSIENQPSTSRSHTLVWTGSEMITWGGSNSSTRRNQGGIYDPENNTWRRTSYVDVPNGRTEHTAVWTGSEMIVWGGSNLNSGGRYDPVNNSWILTNETPGRPLSRGGHSTVWTGAELIIWGGNIHNGPTSTGGIYDPITDQWSTTRMSQAPDPRRLHTAVWTGEEMIIWGGDRNESPLQTGAKYNPILNRWTPINDVGVPEARTQHTAVWTDSEMIVWGGKNGVNLNTGGRYDVESDSWLPTTLTDAPTARRYHTATWTGQNMIIWAGEQFNNFNTSESHLYDPVGDTWQEIMFGGENGPYPRITANHSAVWTGDELIVWGGGVSLAALSGYIFNPTDGTKKPLIAPDFLDSRSHHSAVWTGAEMVVWGGTSRPTVSGQTRTLRSGGRYNPDTDSWTPTTQIGAPPPSSGHQAVWTGSNMMFWGPGPLAVYYPTGKPRYFIDQMASGIWFNREQSGHGLQVQVIDLNGTPAVLAAWYAYINGDPMWLIGVGDIEGNQVTLDMNITEGTGFPLADFDPNQVIQAPWGLVTLTFDSDQQATVAWDSELAAYGSGSMLMERLTQLAPDDSSAPGLRSCHSGSWFNAEQSGHGFLVEVIEAGSGLNMLMTWYTYVNGQQYWLLANGPINGDVATMPAITGSGTSFPNDFNQNDVVLTDWGTLTFTKVDDHNAMVSWSSTLPGFPDGELAVTRLTQLSGFACD